MLAIERRNAILAKISLTGKVLVSDLSRDFGVTEETIRRDLEKLDHDGLVTKTYGGAVKNENYNIDLPFHVRQQENIKKKQHIATLIAAMIHDGDYIMLDSSTTALYVIRSILNLKKISINKTRLFIVVYSNNITFSSCYWLVSISLRARIPLIPKYLAKATFFHSSSSSEILNPVK